MFFFKKKPNIEKVDEDWILDCWAWLGRHLGPVTGADHPDLVPLDRSIIPIKPLPTQGLPELQIDALTTLWGMADWPIELIAQRPSRELPQSVVFAEMSSGGALGTYLQHQNAARITYDPKLAAQPLQLAATLAHELAHYRLSAIAAPPPGGWDMNEFATDLTVAYLGMGLFAANAARSFEAFTDFDRQGWKAERAGYLTENEWTFALAVFTHQRGIDRSKLKPHLKDYLYSGFKKNRAYIDANPQLLMGERSYQIVSS
jgi:hypothetical protein